MTSVIYLGEIAEVEVMFLNIHNINEFLQKAKFGGFIKELVKLEKQKKLAQSTSTKPIF